MGANGLAIESNNEEEENPCDDIFCSAGRECVTNIETNEAKCECIEECPYEVHPRRMVKIFQLKIAICSPNCVQIWKSRERKTVFCRVRHKKC